jgi:hypothetical protein
MIPEPVSIAKKNTNSAECPKLVPVMMSRIEEEQKVEEMVSQQIFQALNASVWRSEGSH